MILATLLFLLASAKEQPLYRRSFLQNNSLYKRNEDQLLPGSHEADCAILKEWSPIFNSASGNCCDSLKVECNEEKRVTRMYTSPFFIYIDLQVVLMKFEGSLPTFQRILVTWQL